VLKDIRLTYRLLAKRPGFATLTVFTLALGIGAASAMFTVVQGVLLTRPPYAEPDRLVLVPSIRVGADGRDRADSTPASVWMAWRRHAQSFAGIAAYEWTFNFLIDAQGSESLEGMIVTPDYFRVMGVQPILGRAFTEADAQSGNAVLLGYDLWRRRFHADPNVIGQTIRMSRHEIPPTIVGVMPTGVRFLPSPTDSREPNYDVNAAVDFWTTRVPNPQRLSQSMWDVVARLKPGTSLLQGQSELSLLAAQQTASDRDLSGQMPRLEPLVSEMNREGRRIVLPLFGASMLVLLIACGNTAALLLIRGLQRQHQYAIQHALGSGRLTVVRQPAIESVALALAGGTAGVGLAVGIVRVLGLVGGHAIPRLDAVSIGWPLFACGLGFSLTAALVASVVPAVRATRQDPIEALKGAGPRSGVGPGERRVLRAVTTLQTALTLVLLFGAGLLIRTMHDIAAISAGYSTDRVLTMTVTAVQGNLLSFHQRALERVSQVPGVQRSAFAWGTPLTGNDWPGLVEIEGHPVVSTKDRVAVPVRSVTPGYFDLIGVPIVAGRDFRASDAQQAASVAVVNQALVDRYFSSTSAVGKRIWDRGREQPPLEIVGVVANARTRDLTAAPEPEIYLSLWQAIPYSKDLLVKTRSDPFTMVEAVRSALREVDPTVAIEHVRTFDEVRNDALAPRIFASRVLEGFSVAATLLTMIGIYGVMTLSVASRRRELAIRSAIGAQRTDLKDLVVREAVRLIAGGIALGVVAALLLSRALQAFLFDVKPTDPITLAGAGAVFAVVSLIACWTPTREAARVSPLEALKSD
jgi:putative ABC transport system permease protein